MKKLYQLQLHLEHNKTEQEQVLDLFQNKHLALMVSLVPLVSIQEILQMEMVCIGLMKEFASHQQDMLELTPLLHNTLFM